MPTRDTAPIGSPCWVDLMTSDTDGIRAFYGGVFGWKAEEPSEEFGGYFSFTKDGAMVAGCMPRMPEAMGPDAWSIYLATDDAAKTVDAAVAEGAQVYVQPMAVADLGTMAVIADPTGAAIGVWQPDTYQGFRTFAEADMPSWFELSTRDYDAAVAFYRNVFRWSTNVASDTPEFRYTTQVEGDAMYAGVMDAAAFLPEGVPSHWSVYFGSNDTDATLARIVEHGGTIVRPAEDTPYGRLAAAADPTGAQFKIVAPNAAMPAK